ncbi:hypothetical protein NFT50_004837 [Salmonella enterica]|nr:hypothetical protein [Salmonella enterica]EJH7016134.1 hypothetical protein [Salmonella enterica]EJH7437809.1 hypothetical protein [Salmonella enterica]EJH7441531.1 hypothetical protein [Salmonella enterica]EJH7877104.1 hypothetical protein [Salmonella enterica]
MHQEDISIRYQAGLLLKAGFCFAVAFLLFGCVTKIAFFFWVGFIVLGLYFAALALYLVVTILNFIFDAL